MASRSAAVRWCEWGRGAFRRACELKRPVLVFSGATNPAVAHVLDSALFADSAVCSDVNENYVPIRLDGNGYRGIYESFKMYAKAAAGSGGDVPFFLAKVDPRSGIPAAVSCEIGRGTQLLDQLRAADVADERAAAAAVAACDTTALAPAPALEPTANEVPQDKYDVTYTLDQAYLQYRDLSYDPFFRYAMGYALSVLSQRHPGFVESELEQIARGGVVDHIRGGVFIGAYSRDWHLPEFSKQMGWQAGLLAACVPFAGTNGTNESVKALAASLVRGIEHHFEHDRSLIFGDSSTYLFTAAEFDSALRTGMPDHIARDMLEMYFGVNTQGNISNDLLDLKPNLDGMNVLTPYKSYSEVAAAFGVSTARVEAVVRMGVNLLRSCGKPAEQVGNEMKLSHYGLALSALAKASGAGVLGSTELAKRMAGKLLGDMLPHFNGVACDDYAYITMGLLDYSDYVASDAATSSERANAVSAALNLTRDQQRKYDCPNKPGQFYYSPDTAHLFARAKFAHDTMEPNYNAISVCNINRLGIELSSNESDNGRDSNNNSNHNSNINSIGVRGSRTHPLSHLSWLQTAATTSSAKQQKLD